MSSVFALAAAKSQIDLFSDGSFQDMISLGSWAFFAPGLGVEDTGVESGTGIEHFEIVAVLAGVETIVRLDQTCRPIRVFTDSECGMLMLQHAVERKRLPIRPMFQRVQHLYDRAVASTALRPISITRLGSSGTKELKYCHKLALMKLRASINADPALSLQAAMRRNTQRLATIRKHQKQLAGNFAALQKEAVMIEEQWRKLGKPPAAAAPTGGADFDLSAESSDQMRQTIALELLDELKTLWQQQELTIRQRFRLPVSRDLYAASVGAMLGSNLLLEQSLEEK
jgi:ribonuclease HI